LPGGIVQNPDGTTTRIADGILKDWLAQQQPDSIQGPPPSSSLRQYRPDGNGGYTAYNPQADRMQGPTPYQPPAQSRPQAGTHTRPVAPQTMQNPQMASPGHHARPGPDLAWHARPVDPGFNINFEPFNNYDYNYEQSKAYAY
jgi:hypothetical protein